MNFFKQNNEEGGRKKQLNEKGSIVTKKTTLRCPRCKATFDSESQMNMHLLGCGSGKLPIMWF